MFILYIHRYIVYILSFYKFGPGMVAYTCDSTTYLAMIEELFKTRTIKTVSSKPTRATQ